jgi:putative hemolysin
MMLWSGLAEILKLGNYEHVFGCASVSLRDDGVTAAEVWRQVNERSLLAEGVGVKPLHRYPVEQLDSQLPASVPALLKGYLKLGARVCGEPAWDPDFNTADFPMLLSVGNMGQRYRKHFGFDLAKPGSAQN